MHPSYWLALAAGVGIAAACGLRAFLPLLILGLASRFLHLQLDPHVRWLASDPALVALGAATVLELAGDKIPIVDHFLDAIGLALRPAAAWLGAYAVLVQWPEPWGAIVALILGTGALGLTLLHAKLRLGSTVFTGGAANPVISVAEDLFTLLLVALALLAPLFVLVLVAFWLFTIVRRRRRREAPSPV